MFMQNSDIDKDLKQIISSKVQKARIGRVKELAENFDPRTDIEALTVAIRELRHGLVQGPLLQSRKRQDSDLWKLTNDIIFYLRGINFTVSPTDTTFGNNYISTTSKSSNQFQATYNRKSQENIGTINRRFMDHKRESTEHIKAMAADMGLNLDKLGPALYKASMKEVFAPLFIDPTHSDPKTAFRLKSHTASGLTTSQREFLKFFKKVMQDHINMSTYRTYDVPDGWMLLIAKSNLSKRESSSPMKRARDIIENGLKITKIKFGEDTDKTMDEEFSLTNKFEEQFPEDGESADENWTFRRRSLLGVDEFGEALPNSEGRIDIYEDNLENVMDAMVMSSLETFYFRDLSEFGIAMIYKIKNFHELTGTNVNNLLDSILLIQKKVIQHSEAEDGTALVRAMDKGATHALIAGTISQALLETFTNPMVTSANYLSDLLYGTLFKQTREFSAKSYARAFNMVTMGSKEDTKLITAMDLEYGFTNSDTAALKETLKLLEQHSIFQTKRLMFVNHIMLSTWQKITMAAYMIEQGSWDAHSLDKEGRLVYDESKDKRFYDKSKSGDEQKEMKMKYEATKLQFAAEHDGLTGDISDSYGDRKLKRAHTSYDTNYIKELIVEMYSSLDAASKSASTFYTWSKLLSKMKTWIFPKASRYFQKPMTAEENASAARLVKIKDPDAEEGFRYEWRGSDTEGIWYTLVDIFYQLGEYKLDIIKNGSLTANQQKNLSKLLGDIIVWGTMYGGAIGLIALFVGDDDLTENQQLVYNRWVMATGDVFFPKSLMDITTGNSSMFVSLSVASRFADSLFKTVIVGGEFAMNGDETSEEDLLRALNNVGRNSSGVYKTLEIIHDTVKGED